MIDLTSFQTAWDEYHPSRSLGDSVSAAAGVGAVFFLLVGFGALVAVFVVDRPSSLGSFCKKVLLPSVVSGLIAAAIAFGVMVCNMPSNAGNATKPDSFGTVISERYGLDSVSCRNSYDVGLDMAGDMPRDGEYACTGYDSKHIYKNLTLVVNDNKAGLYDKKGNALTLKETNNAD